MEVDFLEAVDHFVLLTITPLDEGLPEQILVQIAELILVHLVLVDEVGVHLEGGRHEILHQAIQPVVFVENVLMQDIQEGDTLIIIPNSIREKSSFKDKSLSFYLCIFLMLK